MRAPQLTEPFGKDQCDRVGGSVSLRSMDSCHSTWPLSQASLWMKRAVFSCSALMDSAPLKPEPNQMLSFICSWSLSYYNTREVTKRLSKKKNTEKS